jgi:hypothetical protein
MKRFQMHDIVKVIKLLDNRFDKFTPSTFTKRPPQVGDVGTIVTVSEEEDVDSYCVECVDDQGRPAWLEYMRSEELELNRSIDDM